MKDASQEPLTLKARFISLWKGYSSPHEIALGVAIGVFIGITPFYGLHIVTALLAAFVFKRVNKVAIFLGTSISLPPTVPFITCAGYSIGRTILGGAYPPFHWDDFRHFSFDSFIDFFYVLTMGSFILGMILSVLFYYVTLAIFNKRSARLRRPKIEAISIPLDGLKET